MFCLPAALLLSAARAESRPAETGIIIEPQLVVDLAVDHPDEDLLEAYARLRAWTRIPTERGFWRFEARGQQILQSGGAEIRVDSLESTWELELGESSWEGSLGPNWMAIGNRVERWGRQDVLGVVDVLNGQDVRAGPLTPPELMRIPAPMATISTSGRVGIELTFLPFGATDRVALIGSDWSMVKPGMLETLIEDMGTWEGDALTEAYLQDAVQTVGGLLEQLSPRGQAQLGDLIAAQADSALPGSNSELAVRSRTSLGRHDLNLMLAWIRSRQAVPVLDPSLSCILQEERLPTLVEQTEMLQSLSDGITVERPRTWMLGADWSSWIGRFGVRAETAWLSNQPVATPWMGSGSSSSVSAAAGLDWMYSASLALVLEGSWVHLVDPPDALWLQAADSVNLAMMARFSLLADRLELRPAVLWDVSFNEWLVRPAVSWRPRDSLRMDLSMLLISADGAVPRELGEAMETPLGPLGYVSENDSLVLSIAWIQ